MPLALLALTLSSLIMLGFVSSQSTLITHLKKLSIHQSKKSDAELVKCENILTPLHESLVVCIENDDVVSISLEENEL